MNLVLKIKVINQENAIHVPPQKKFREIQKKILGKENLF